MLQTLLWISRLEKTFGKNSSKSGQKYFAKCASYTSNYIESKSASINCQRIYFFLFIIWFIRCNTHSWNYESWLYFHEKKVCWCSNTWKLSFSIEIDSYINFFFLSLFSFSNGSSFWAGKILCDKFGIRRYKIGFFHLTNKLLFIK